MRVACVLFAGLSLIWVSCGDSSSPGDLFTPGTGGSQGATGSGGSGDTGTSATTGAAGSKSGSGGGVSVGTGGQATGAGGSGGSGTGGAGMTGGGGSAGSGGSPAGAGGTADGGRGGSGPGGAAGTAGTAGGGGAPPDGGSAGRPPDSGGPLHPIRCGNTTCSAPGEFCCIPTNNQIPRCVAPGGLCPLNADRVACDDRTDCPDPLRQICCAENPNGPNVADCRLPLNCDAQNAGQQLCDPLQTASCFMPGLTSCMLDQQAIITGYPYCH
jgi:hypothetical protein